jgi:hypothetical protein
MSMVEAAFKEAYDKDPPHQFTMRSRSLVVVVEEEVVLFRLLILTARNIRSVPLYRPPLFLHF